MAKVHSVYTVIRDMNRAERFYAAALDLQPAFRDGERWCQFKLGDTRFALSSAEEAAPGAVGSVAVFEVEELAVAEARVIAVGGQLLMRRDMGAHGATLTFADPDGNLFQLFSRPAGAAS